VASRAAGSRATTNHTSWSLMTAPRWLRQSRWPRRAWIGGGSTWTASTSSSATASITAPAVARQRNALVRASWSWAPATRPARPCSTSRMRRHA